MKKRSACERRWRASGGRGRDSPARDGVGRHGRIVLQFRYLGQLPFRSLAMCTLVLGSNAKPTHT